MTKSSPVTGKSRKLRTMVLNKTCCINDHWCTVGPPFYGRRWGKRHDTRWALLSTRRFTNIPLDPHNDTLRWMFLHSFHRWANRSQLLMLFLHLGSCSQKYGKCVGLGLGLKTEEAPTREKSMRRFCSFPVPGAQ